jgi:hypothetical protein
MSWKSRFHNRLTAGVVWRYRAAVYSARLIVDQASCSPYHPCRVICVDPHAVTHLLDQRLDNRTLGVVLPGDWDINAIPIEVTRVGRARRQGFVGVRSCPQTPLHPDATDVVDQMRGKYAGQIKDFEARTAYLDELWRRMRVEGYRNHDELGEPLESVMTACVGRSGQLVRNKGGLHRLVMAQLLGLERAPARIIAVHPDFVGKEAAGILREE